MVDILLKYVSWIEVVRIWNGFNCLRVKFKGRLQNERSCATSGSGVTFRL
jgi:hypothetical protein